MIKVYMETSLWAMIGPNQNPALQEPSMEFLSQCSTRIYEPYISAVVMQELRRAPTQVRKIVLAKLNEINPAELPVSAEADKLAESFIKQGILSQRRLDDARHVACAMLNRMDWLVSWNYRHIVNVRKAEAFNAVAVLAGIPGKLQIHTPLEVLDWKKP